MDRVSLIYKVLSGEASAAEQNELDEWIAQAPENKAEFEDIKLLWASTHNLWKLRKKAKPHSKELFQVFRAETDQHEEYLFDLLNRGYVDARYRTDYSITHEELSTLIARVTLMVPVVEGICRERIASFG